MQKHMKAHRMRYILCIGVSHDTLCSTDLSIGVVSARGSLVIQSLLGHSSTRSTEPYIHPSLDKIRQAMEKLPGVVYMKELVETGILNLKFQSEYHKRE